MVLLALIMGAVFCVWGYFSYNDALFIFDFEYQKSVFLAFTGTLMDGVLFGFIVTKIQGARDRRASNLASRRMLYILQQFRTPENALEIVSLIKSLREHNDDDLIFIQNIDLSRPETLAQLGPVVSDVIFTFGKSGSQYDGVQLPDMCRNLKFKNCVFMQEDISHKFEFKIENCEFSNCTFRALHLAQTPGDPTADQSKTFVNVDFRNSVFRNCTIENPDFRTCTAVSKEQLFDQTEFTGIQYTEITVTPRQKSFLDFS